MEKLLTPEQLAELLGIELTTVYSWVSRKKIPYYKPSRKILRFLESEITDWLRNCRNMSTAPSKNISEALKHNKGSGKIFSPNSVESIIKNAKKEVLNE